MVQSGATEVAPLSINTDEAASKAAGKPAVIDLCCGLGGMSLGARMLGWEVIAGVDISHHAVRSFTDNFPTANAIEGSVRSGTALSECLEKFDSCSGRLKVLVSGPPCQGFSVAGTRDPQDPRNQILAAVARAICYLKPDIAVVENVSMLMAKQNSKKVALFDSILKSGGYTVQRMVLDAASFGVPQRRKRTIMFITRTAIDKEELVKTLGLLNVTPKTVHQTLSDLPRPKMRPIKLNIKGRAELCVIPNHLSMRHSWKVRRKIAAIKPGSGPLSYRRLHPDRIANTLISGHRAPPAHYSQARSITVREAARLQGFPDSFKISGSFGSQMTQVTNAVPPPLAMAALKALAVVVAAAKPS